jgi:cytochrome c oxidase subunit 2
MFNFPLSPPSASNLAGEHDIIFYTLCALSLFFTTIVAVAILIFVIRYRQGTKVDRSRPVHEHLPLEITWSVIPLLLGLVVFFGGAYVFVDMRSAPKDATEIFVIGKQWMWHIQHANGVRENNMLHVPVGKPVKLTMISQDVIHAFYVPAFRVQYQVVPGRYTSVWFTPTKVGNYHLFCGMFCGTQHSEMVGTVVAMEPKEFAAWMANGGNDARPITMVQAGARKFAQLGCGNCHTGGDTERGPTLYGLAGTTRSFTDGSSAKADDAYLRESILNPYNRITKGYAYHTMPAYAGQISEGDVLNLLAYMKSLGTAAANTAEDLKSGEMGGQAPVKPVPAVGAIGARERMTEEQRGNISVGAINARQEGDR